MKNNKRPVQKPPPAVCPAQRARASALPLKTNQSKKNIRAKIEEIKSRRLTLLYCRPRSTCSRLKYCKVSGFTLPGKTVNHTYSRPSTVTPAMRINQIILKRDCILPPSSEDENTKTKLTVRMEQFLSCRW